VSAFDLAPQAQTTFVDDVIIDRLDVGGALTLGDGIVVVGDVLLEQSGSVAADMNACTDVVIALDPALRVIDSRVCCTCAAPARTSPRRRGVLKLTRALIDALHERLLEDGLALLDLLLNSGADVFAFADHHHGLALGLDVAR
jgi:hypothetical protein